jgi:hypothetical protein
MKWSVANRRQSDGKTQHFESENEGFTSEIGSKSNNDGPTDGDGLDFHFYLILISKYMSMYLILSIYKNI